MSNENNAGVDLDSLPLHFDREYYRVEDVRALLARRASATPSSKDAGGDLYAAALLAVERMRGCAATYIEDHGKDTYPGAIGLRPQDVATMWAQEIHSIDAKAYLDEAIDDLRVESAGAAAKTEQADAEEAAKLQTLLMTEFDCYRTAGGGLYAWAMNALLDNSPHRMGGDIRGPLTDTQREECRTLYNNLKHLQLGGIYVADDVIRRAAVFGYMNGRKDFGTSASAAGAGSELPENWQVREAVNRNRGAGASLVSDAAVGEIMTAVRSLARAPLPAQDGQAVDDARDAAWQSGYKTGYETGLGDGRAEFTNPHATSPAERAAMSVSRLDGKGGK